MHEGNPDNPITRLSFPHPQPSSLHLGNKKSTIPEDKDPGYMSSPPVSTTEGFICGGIAACIAVGPSGRPLHLQN